MVATLNPPVLPDVLPFRCPQETWHEPTQLDEPAREGAWVMVETTTETVRPPRLEPIELAQGTLSGYGDSLGHL